MYVYIKIGDVWEAGFYLTKYSHDGTPYNQFMGETRWANEWAAAARVNDDAIEAMWMSPL